MSIGAAGAGAVTARTRTCSSVFSTVIVMKRAAVTFRGDEPFKFRLANAETVISGFSGARTLMGQVAHSGHRWHVRQRRCQDVVLSGVVDPVQRE